MIMSNEKYYAMDEVVGNSRFFWIGRGGYAITQPSNGKVRSLIASHKAEYASLKRSQRGRVVTALLENELKDIKFVIPATKAVEGLLGNSVNAKGARLLGEPRRKSILSLHGSVEAIQSYPEKVCIEVGLAWTKDIVSHLLREDAKESNPKKPIQSHTTNHRPSKKRQSDSNFLECNQSAESKRRKFVSDESKVLHSDESCTYSVHSCAILSPSGQQHQKSTLSGALEDFAPSPLDQMTKQSSVDSLELSRLLYTSMDSQSGMDLFSSADLVSKMLLDHRLTQVVSDEEPGSEEAIFAAIADDDFDLLHTTTL